MKGSGPVPRVVLVGPIYPLRGGIALHSARWAAALRDAGCAVRVLSWQRQYPSAFFPGQTEMDPGVPVCALGDPPPEAVLDSLRPRSWSAGVRYLLECRPEVAVIQRWHPFLAPALAWIARELRRAGVRIIWMVHNARTHEAYAWAWSPLARLGYAGEDLCLVHAESEAKALHNLGVGGPIEVVKHPSPTPVALPSLDTARRSLGLPVGGEVFLFFGHVRRYKGVENFLEALASLPKGPRPWQALVVGEWYYSSSAAEKYLERHGLRSHVRFVNRFVPEDEVPTYFAAASAVVLPYRRGTQSGVPAQSLAFGRPVLVTDVGAVASAVTHGRDGLVLPAEDPQALQQALYDVLEGRSFSVPIPSEGDVAASWAPLVRAVVEAGPG